MPFFKQLWFTLAVIGLLSSQIAVTSAQTPGNVVYGVDWNPDGSKVALTTNDGIRIYNQDFQFVQFFPFSDPLVIPYAQWSPDGTRLTAGQMVIDAATLEPIFTTASPMIFTQWSPDGTFLVKMAVDYKGIELYDAQTGNLMKTLSTDGIQMSYPALLSPDGTHFLTRDHTNTIVIIDAVNGGITAHYEMNHSVSNMIWSPDSKRIAYGGVEEVPPNTPGSFLIDGNTTKAMLIFVGVLDTANGQSLRISDQLSGGVSGFSWSPSGNELIGVAAQGLVYIWNSSTGDLLDSFLAAGQIMAADYTPYGGRYTLATYPRPELIEAMQESFTPSSTFNQLFLGGQIQVIVPTPSVQKLGTIAQACNLQSTIEQSIKTEMNHDDLQVFSNQISQLDGSEIALGCKADLIAVAEALQAGH